MELAFQLIFSFGVFLLLLAAGMAVPFAIAVPGILYLLMQHGLDAVKGIGLVTWGSMNSFTLSAIPLFILMAELMQRSGLSFRIYRGLAKIVSRLPGGLLQTNIVGCALFASISGSSVATAASIGGVALPQLVQRNYDRRLSAGSLAAGGTLGILLPPSIAMIIYGTFTETSVAKLFMAGVIPGMLLTLMFMTYIAVRSFWGGAVPRGRAAGRHRLRDRAGRYRAFRTADRLHHGQHLRRLGDAHRGRVRRLPVLPHPVPGLGRPDLARSSRTPCTGPCKSAAICCSSSTQPISTLTRSAWRVSERA